MSRLLLLGGKASEEDLLVGKPWAGEDGEFLRRVVGAMGLADEAHYWTVTSVLEPCVEEVNEGAVRLRSMLEQELLAVSVIVPLGKEAQRAVGVKGQTLRIAGVPQDLTLGKRIIKVVPLAHPKYVLRNPAYASEWQSGWGVVQQMLDRGIGDWFDALGPVTFGSLLQEGVV